MNQSPETRLTPANLADLPNRPGVYLFYDRQGDLLYVGKSVRLRERVRSYFRPDGGHSSRIRRMVRFIREIGYYVCGSELEALLQESRLIKTRHPRYNVLQRTYRNYYFLRLHPTEPFPRLDFTNEPLADGAKYFGPFRGYRTAQIAAETLQRVSLLRLCDGSLQPRPDHPTCFYGQIGRCLKPCDGTVSPSEYAAAVQQTIDFIHGHRGGVLEKLRQERDRAAAEMRFEAAAELRDRIREIERILYRQQLISTAIDEHNVIIILPSAEPNRRELFFIEAGRFRAQQRVCPQHLPVKTLRTILTDVYRQRAPTDIPIRADEIDELRLVATWLYHRREEGQFVYVGGELDVDATIEAIRAAMRSMGGGCHGVMARMVSW